MEEFHSVLARMIYYNCSLSKLTWQINRCYIICRYVSISENKIVLSYTPFNFKVYAVTLIFEIEPELACCVAKNFIISFESLLYTIKEFIHGIQ
ncbi:MAG: hypothetical protein ACPKPY_10340 [Nitrososphaeraceae archaeon]